MKRNYQSYSKGQFERLLWLIKAEKGIGFIQEISGDLKNNSELPYCEYIYSIPTSLSNVRILIYSSVDKRTDMTRENGTDAVRIVLESVVNQKAYRKKVQKRLRIKTLHKNLSESIQSAMNYVEELKIQKVA
jgi:hypothetical protein